jgi:DNA-binding response OmpR family regulator
MSEGTGSTMTDNKYKILVADDEPQVLEITVRKLREAGYDVVGAADGIEAWERIQSDSPDIVILDLNMPRRDGFTVLRDMRAQPPHGKWRPVIIVSARNELADVRKGMGLHADSYLTKPCDIVDILKAIRLMEKLIPMRIEDEPEEGKHASAPHP